MEACQLIGFAALRGWPIAIPDIIEEVSKVLPDLTEEAIESLQWHGMVDMLIDEETELKHQWWMGIDQADFLPSVGVLNFEQCHVFTVSQYEGNVNCQARLIRRLEEARHVLAEGAEATMADIDCTLSELGEMSEARDAFKAVLSKWKGKAPAAGEGSST
jgi:hypothetical protein